MRSFYGANVGTVVYVEIVFEVPGFGDLSVEQSMLFLFRQPVFGFAHRVYFHTCFGRLSDKTKHLGVGFELYGV